MWGGTNAPCLPSRLGGVCSTPGPFSRSGLVLLAGPRRPRVGGCTVTSLPLDPAQFLSLPGGPLPAFLCPGDGPLSPNRKIGLGFVPVCRSDSRVLGTAWAADRPAHITRRVSRDPAAWNVSPSRLLVT